MSKCKNKYHQPPRNCRQLTGAIFRRNIPAQYSGAMLKCFHSTGIWRMPRFQSPVSRAISLSTSGFGHFCYAANFSLHTDLHTE